jgi:hypothetical protein
MGEFFGAGEDFCKGVGVGDGFPGGGATGFFAGDGECLGDGEGDGDGAAATHQSGRPSARLNTSGRNLMKGRWIGRSAGDAK